MVKNKLYHVTNKLGTFYIVANSFDDANEKLTKRLNDADYGFTPDRTVLNIECVADESFLGERQLFHQDIANLIS